MSLPFSIGISNPGRSIRTLCAAASLIVIAGCGSGTATNVDGELLSAALETEVLKVSLSPEDSYQWRVRAITESDAGPWSSKFLVRPDADSEIYFDVSLIGPEALAEDAFADALLEDSSEKSIADAFYDLLFVDTEQQSEEDSLQDDQASFSGIPTFTWQPDENAAAYEIEITNASTRQRLGIFQYEENSLCIGGVCELILENTVEASLDLPPIPLIVHTSVHGEAPYQIVLPSPVLDPSGLDGYSHQWSIEGQFNKFPDTPEFRHEFAEAGSHTVNVLVTSPDGRSEFAYVSVEVSESEMTFTGIPTDVEGTDPDLSAALPEENTTVADKGPLDVLVSSGENSPDTGSDVAVALAAPDVSVRESEHTDVVQASEESIGSVAQGPVGEQPDAEAEVSESSDRTEEGPAESESANSAELEPAEVIEASGGSGDSSDKTNGQPGKVADIIDLEDADTLVFNNDLPMGGLFYGHPGNGWKTGNGKLALESARRFMAERSGRIVAVKHENRTLLDYNITGRCTSKDPNSAWCKCKNAGLDKYTCGYTLSNSYSVGNGGSIVVEVREDDGSDEHLPSEVVLGRSVQPYVPMDAPHYPEIALDSPVELEAGKLYHIVYRNVNPPTGCSWKNVSVSDAARCPRDQGAMGLNGVTHQVDEGPTARFGPFLSRSPAVTYRSSSSSSWRTHDTVTSWYEVKYEDDTWVGDTMVAYDSRLSSVDRTIEGSTRGRQVFTVTDTTRTVDGLWLNHGHKSHADGSPMRVELKSSNGVVLAQGEVPRSEECMPIIKNESNSFEKGCRAWGYAEFGLVVDLVLGSTYTLEFSAPSKAGFTVTTYFTASHIGSTDRNHWNDAHGEISTDGGSSWDFWTSKFQERDVPVLFTIQGQPRQIR